MKRRAKRIRTKIRCHDSYWNTYYYDHNEMNCEIHGAVIGHSVEITIIKPFRDAEYWIYLDKKKLAALKSFIDRAEVELEERINNAGVG